MKCSICGHEGRAGAIACSRCGAPMNQGAPEPEVDDRTTLRSIAAQVPVQSALAPVIPEPTPADLSPVSSAVPDPAWLGYAAGGEQNYRPAASLQAAVLSTLPASVQRLKVLAFVMAGLGLVSLIQATTTLGSRAGIQAVAAIVGIVLYIVLAFQVQARKNWARIVIGVFAILGGVGNLFTLISSLGVLALLQGMIGSSYVVPIVFGLILVVVGEVLLILVAVNAFHRDTVTWCAPVPPPVPLPPS